MFPDLSLPPNNNYSEQSRLANLKPEQLARLSQEMERFRQTELFRLYKTEYQEAHQQLMEQLFNLRPSSVDDVITLLQLLACGREQKERIEYFEELSAEIITEAKSRKEQDNDQKLEQSIGRIG